MRLILVLFFIWAPVMYAIGTFTEKSIDRIKANTESQVTILDTLRLDTETNNTVPFLNASKDLVSSLVTDTELGYLSGVTGPIQAQIDAAVTEASNNTFTGTNDFQNRLTVTTTTQASIPCPVMTEAQRDLLTPVQGDCVFNSDTNQQNNYDGSAWVLVGGGGGGGGCASSLNLMADGCFEGSTPLDDLTCSSCTESAETTEAIEALQSYKAAFTASSGNTLGDFNTGVEYTNQQMIASCRIKTSASDVVFYPRVDGSDLDGDSTTLNVVGDNIWRLYEIPFVAGTTSVGFKVDAKSTITDDVFIDDCYVGVLPMHGTPEIAQAEFFGSVKWETTSGCDWGNTTSSSYNGFVDLDCDNNPRVIKGAFNITNGDAANADGTIPQIKFSKMPAGNYRIVAKGSFRDDDNVDVCNYRFTDGTNTTVANTIFTTATIHPMIEGEFSYDNAQGATTWSIEANNNNSGVCQLQSRPSNRELEISVYYYPPKSKIYSQGQNRPYVSAKFIESGGNEQNPTFEDALSGSGVWQDSGVIVSKLNNSTNFKIVCSDASEVDVNGSGNFSCATGEEQFRVKVDLRGDYKVCAEMTHSTNTTSSSNTNYFHSFRIDGTDLNTANTVADAGGGAPTNLSKEHNINMCRLWRFTKETEIQVRWDIDGATPSINRLTGPTVLNITPVNTNPVVIGQFSGTPKYQDQGAMIAGYASFGGVSDGLICSSNPCTVYRQIGTLNWSGTRNSLGNYTITVSGFAANSNIFCDAHGDDDVSNTKMNTLVENEAFVTDGSGQAVFDVLTRSPDASAADEAYLTVKCEGPR